jgi:hypothetical protein
MDINSTSQYFPFRGCIATPKFLKKGEKQMSTEDANLSKLVTKASCFYLWMDWLIDLLIFGVLTPLYSRLCFKYIKKTQQIFSWSGVELLALYFLFLFSCFVRFGAIYGTLCSGRLLWCFNATFNNISPISRRPVFNGGGSRSTRREPPTMGKQLVNLITCGCESSAPIFPLNGKFILIKLQMFYQIPLIYQLKLCSWITEMSVCGSCFIEVSRNFNVDVY